MRVLHVMEATIGGTRRHIVDLALGQKATGLDVHLCVAALRQPAFKRDIDALRREGIDVVELPMVREIQPATDARQLREIGRLLADLQPDVVHTHSSKAGVLGRLASSLSGIGARVHTPHTFAFLFEATMGSLKRKLFWEIERALAADTAALVAVSRTEARTFLESGVAPAERIRLVENGIDPRPWREALGYRRAELELPEERTLAAVVGRVDVDKGQDLALEALARPGLDELDLVVVGDGGGVQALGGRARELGLAGRVHVLGWRDDVPRILPAMDLLLLPSRWEGMPYAVLEAMTVGLPVVAHPVDGARDLILDGESGFLAAAIGADALADALRAYLATGDAERGELAERARAVAGERTLERMVGELVDVYESVV